MKPFFPLILAGLPIAAIVAYYLMGAAEQSPTRPTIPPAKLTVRSKPKAEPQSRAPDTGVDKSWSRDAINKSEDERTERKYDAAEREAKIDIDSYPSQIPFMLNKHRATFDAWGLSEAKRQDVVNAIQQHGRSLGKAFRDSAMAWPLAVGHVANAKADNAHSLALVNRSKTLQQELHSRLAQIAGVEFADEFMHKNYSSADRNKNDD